MQTAIDTMTAPLGCYGLAVEPWGAGEIYAVAANWGLAYDQVRVWGRNGWSPDDHGRQVADFRHDPLEALDAVIREVIEMGGFEPDDDGIADILAAAVDIQGAEE